MRPSFFLALSSLALAISGYLLYLGGETPSAFDPSEYLRRGWEWAEVAGCPGAEPFRHYEITSETEAMEALHLEQGRWLTAHARMPDPPYICRPIPSPTFIQEIE